ncbi:MAG: ribonuclease E/G [Rhodobacteraceae bacterium]|nr:ribonuclease E/G [Paracoccaceae bacterium]
MAKKMLIDATHAEETRVVVVDGNKVEEFDFESQNKRQLAGNIYLAKVTRVEPSLQAAFVDYGGNRHGFLAFSEIHPDYYQIPVADREALLAEERAYAEAQRKKEEEEEPKKKSRSRSRSKAKAAKTDDAVTSEAVESDIDGMETIDVQTEEGSSPMELVAETPVDTPASGEDEADATADAPEAAEEAPAAAEQAEDASDDAAAVQGEDDAEEGTKAKGADASEKDDSIESVAQEDDEEEVRPVRKPRPRRYKIQEVMKVRQILLVQVVKEERGNKGAALTTYLSLAGRYCVLMPNTARGGGISRKITNATDRKKLKEIANTIEVPDGAGLIVRTAGAKRTKTEIKRDYEYLQRLWEQIRELTLKSTAPAKIYEEGDLIKRSIRDLYGKEIDEVIVEGERGYRSAKDFMKMIMPSHAKNVKHYQDGLPLFARHQVEGYLDGMFNPTVQLRSGGYIVIGITEALVAIDVNSGKATKEGSIEETALKTNMEAAEEVARQLRLRDLAGLIVIDFIDMEDRRNNAKVEKLMKDKLKTDRARIQVGRISGFGLMEMSRQRLRPGMLEASTQPCPHCHGTGLIRSDDSMGLTILRQLEEEGTRRRTREVLVTAPVKIANFLINQKREYIAQIEARHGMSVRVEADPHMVSPDYTVEKFKTATRVVAEAPVVTGDASLMDDWDEAEEAAATEAETEAPSEDAADAAPKKKRRRRRRRRGGGGGANGENGAEGQSAEGQSAEGAEGEASAEAPAAEEGAAEAAEATEAAPEGEAPAEEEKPKKSSRSRSRSRSRKAADEAPADEAAEAPAEADAPGEAEAEPAAEEKPAPKKRTRSRKKAAPKEEAPTEAAEAEAPAAEAEAPAEPEPAPEPVPEPVAEAAEAAPEPEAAADEPAKPKRKGWWSLGR